MQEKLFEAFFWDVAVPRPALSAFLSDAEFRRLLGGWGRDGDRGLIAEFDEMPVGAAWFRQWTHQVHSYGFVDPDTPEVSIGLRKEYRSKGFGRLLLSELIEQARAEGHAGLSLSVSPRNYALGLYTSMGFARVGESGTSWTLVLPLNRKGKYG